jgi:Holliday junction DNA helicase RuvA
MIAFLRGKIVFIEANSVVLDVSGVGYRIFVPASCQSKLPAAGEEMLLLTYLSVKEDSLQLYGFIEQQERELFVMLLNVGGIGPKGALSVLSCLSPAQLYLAVAREDIKAVMKVPGIGKKTAQRLILELKDKLKGRVQPGEETTPETVSGSQNEAEDALFALEALGYSVSEAIVVVQEVLRNSSKNISASELLKNALQKLDARR